MEEKPTIGRIIHYGLDESWRSDPHPKVLCCAAIITQVNEDGTVHLAAFLPGNPMMMTFSFVPYAASLAKGSWTWPPRSA